MGTTVRTRFAPSPTGFMHVGNLRTALYEYLIAKSQGGTFVLRIEDTDRERLVEGAVDVIYNTLEKVGLRHDEGPDIGGEYGPYVQSERKDTYRPFAEQLVKEGKAYYCFCDKERLESLHQESGEFGGYDRHCRNLPEEEVQKLLDAGVPYVIIGHSERRQYFGETDVTVRNRVRAALNEGLKVILCVGEVLSERKDGITSQIVSAQTEIALGGVSADELKNIIIAYEPVWAIGTGETATPEQANEVCAVIRSLIERLYGKDAADAIVVQYGGSMNDKNAAELLAQPDVDGGLIGGASLVAEKFTAIVNAASAK